MSNFLKALKVKGIEIDTAGAITGDVLKYDGSKFGAASAGGGSSVTVSDTAPVSPTAGNLWFKSDTGNLLVYYDSYWIDAAAPAYSTLDGGTA